MARSFLNFIFVALVSHVIAEDFVKWVNKEVSSNPIKIKQSAQAFELVRSGEGYCINSTDVRKYNVYPNQKNLTKVKCQLFISFNEHQDKGIHTCQDDDNEHILISSPAIKKPNHDSKRKINCSGLTQNIIEGEEVTINCTRRWKDYYERKITVGWIQGKRNFTQIHDLKTSIKVLKFNQTLKGFKSGDGIFFYCVFTKGYNSISDLCYTLILQVYPQLHVEIKTLFEASENDIDQYCFKCHADGGSGEKSYNWTLNREEVTENNSHHKDEECFYKLPAGNHTVKCLVSTHAQNNFDLIEFTVKDLMSTDTSVTPRRNGKIVIMILLATTTILVFFVLIVYIFLLKRKHNNRQAALHQIDVDITIRGISEAPQTSADEEYTSENTVEREDIYYVKTETIIAKKSCTANNNYANTDTQTSTDEYTSEETAELEENLYGNTDIQTSTDDEYTSEKTAELEENLYVNTDTQIGTDEDVHYYTVEDIDTMTEN